MPERKAFECTMCGACCSNLGQDQVVLLLAEDIVAMARGLRMSVDDLLTRYCETNEHLSRRAGRPIVQLSSRDRRCVFLGRDNKCEIHTFKPFQCKNGPDRFLPGAMRLDYECMQDVEFPPDEDVTEYFFNALLEDRMPSGPAINVGLQIDAARKRQLAGAFSKRADGAAKPVASSAVVEPEAAVSPTETASTDGDDQRREHR